MAEKFILPPEAFSDSGAIKTRILQFLLSIGLRYCGRCKEVKSIEHFGIRGEEGFKNRCKICNTERLGVEIPEEAREAARLAAEHRLTRSSYESRRPKLGYHQCETCQKYFRFAGMLTRSLCYSCAKELLGD